MRFSAVPRAPYLLVVFKNARHELLTYTQTHTHTHIHRDLEIWREISALDPSAPHLLVIFENGCHELLTLSSVFAQLLQLPNTEDRDSSDGQLPLESAGVLERVAVCCSAL